MGLNLSQAGGIVVGGRGIISHSGKSLPHGNRPVTGPDVIKKERGLGPEALSRDQSMYAQYI